MSLQFLIRYKVISNDHEPGMCSDDECEEREENYTESKLVEYPPEFFKDPNSIKIGEKYTEGQMFQMISEDHNFSEINYHGSEYCRNRSIYERHSINYVAEEITFLGRK